MQGLIFDIKHYAIHDGPGIRTTIFFKGCPMCCPWCHNPESQEMQPERITRERVLDGTAIIETEIIGRSVDSKDIMAEISKDLVFYQESSGGVTFSGGEPLMQPAFLEDMLDRCHEMNIHKCLDTTGYTKPSIFNKIIPKVDLFLYDLKLMDRELHGKYTSVSNEWIMTNLKTLASSGKNVIIRFPVIPGITHTKSNTDDIISFLKSLEKIRRIDLLPYHSIARNKYKLLNREFNLDGMSAPTDDELHKIKLLFEKEGFEVGIGG